MDLKAKYLSDTCSDPIDFLYQLRLTTEPIGGDTEYREDGELVEYDVAIEAVKKANDVFIEKATEYLQKHLIDYWSQGVTDESDFIENFRSYMENE